MWSNILKRNYIVFNYTHAAETVCEMCILVWLHYKRMNFLEDFLFGLLDVITLHGRIVG